MYIYSHCSEKAPTISNVHFNIISPPEIWTLACNTFTNRQFVWSSKILKPANEKF